MSCNFKQISGPVFGFVLGQLSETQRDAISPTAHRNHDDNICPFKRCKINAFLLHDVWIDCARTPGVERSCVLAKAFSRLNVLRGVVERFCIRVKLARIKTMVKPPRSHRNRDGMMARTTAAAAATFCLQTTHFLFKPAALWNARPENRKEEREQLPDRHSRPVDIN